MSKILKENNILIRNIYFDILSQKKVIDRS